MVSSLVGYMGYDFIRLFENLPRENKDNIKIPYAVFMRPTTLAIFDNLKNTITIAIIVIRPKEKIDKKKIFKIYENTTKKILKFAMS